MPTTPRSRVIIDNDFSGDPDDLFQLVHHALSPSIAIPFVIGSHLRWDDPHDMSDRQASNATRIAREWLQLVDREDIPVVLGSERALLGAADPARSEAAAAIVAEALRDDTELPLYFAAGGGLTDLASALLIEPAIATRLTLIWIGGEEYPKFGPPPASPDIEYNLNIDPVAASVVFSSRSLQIWQIPRDVYRQCLMSQSELDTRVRPMGVVGQRLAEAIDGIQERLAEIGRPLGETYAMGDSPLVLLTALQSAFEPDASSSSYVTVPSPQIDAAGRYDFSTPGRDIRVYTTVDTRLMFEDLFCKLQLLANSANN